MDDLSIKRENMNYEEDEIDLMELLAVLIRNRVLIIGITIVSLVISLGVAVATSKSSKEATAIIAYNYEGVSEGKTPSGDVFTPKEIASTNVINRVYSKYPELAKKGISLVELESALNVSGIVPSGVDKIVEAKLKSGERYSFHPSSYKVNFKLTNNSDLDKKILSEILYQYQEYFDYKYEGNLTLPLLEGGKLKVYDFNDQLSFIGKNINLNIQRIKKIEKREFISGETGYSYSDILSSYQAINDVDVRNLVSVLNTKKLTKDYEFKKDILADKIELLEVEGKKSQGEVEVLAQMILDFKPSERKMIIPTLGETGINISTEEEYYSELLKEYRNTKSKVIGLDIDRDLLKKEILELKEVDSELEVSIQNDINKVIDKVNEVTLATNIMNREYYKKLNSDAVEIVSPVTTISGSNSKLIVAIGSVLGVMFALFIVIVKEFTTHYKESQKKTEKVELI